MPGFEVSGRPARKVKVSASYWLRDLASVYLRTVTDLIRHCSVFRYCQEVRERVFGIVL